MGRGVGELDATTWLEEHGDALFRYAITRVRDSSVAEDLVQETLLSAMTAVSSLGVDLSTLKIKSVITVPGMRAPT